MYTEQEKERIEQQVEYDKTHYIRDGQTIFDWKKKFESELFVEESYWEKEIEIPNGDRIIKIWIKCEETDPNGKTYLRRRTIVNPKNHGISKAVRNQIAIYGETMPEDEIKFTCNEIITKAIRKFRIKYDCKEGQEVNQLASYILTCLKKEMQNYINDYTGTFRERIGGTDRMFSPKMMMSYDVEVDENDMENDDRHIDYVSEEQNLFTVFDEYNPTDTLKIILNTLQSDLTDEQIELMKILAITENNNMETARIIKELDIERGNELRASDDAYRVAIIREKAKIVKLVERNIDLHQLEKIAKLKLERDEINKFLDYDITEKEVIDYTVENININYIDNIVYEQLGLKQRQYLIKNFFHAYNEDKLNNTCTIEVCRYILNGLYRYTHKLDKDIESLKNTKVEKLEPITEKRKPYQGNKVPNTYKYYVEKDKYEQLKEKNKNELTKLKRKRFKTNDDELRIRYLEEFEGLEILGEETIVVTEKRTHLLKEKLLLDHDSRSEFYNRFEIDCYYLGERKDISKERKQEFAKIDQRGMRYKINEVTTEPEELND